MHISKMIDYVKNEIHFTQEFCEYNVFVTLRIEPILRIIENLEQSHKDILEITKENKKKDKIIDLIIEEYEYNERINLKDFCENELRKDTCIQDCKTCIKQYFKQKSDK